MPESLPASKVLSILVKVDWATNQPIKINHNKDMMVVDDFIQPFLAALRAHAFDECRAQLAFMQATLPEQPAAAAQIFYMEGLLANEADRDAAAAERALVRALAMTNEPLWRARILRALGVVYDYQNQSAKALATFQTLVELHEATQQQLDLARTLKNIGIACEKGYARGDLSSDHLSYGEACCQRALTLFTQCVATDATMNADLRWEQSTTRNTLGALYMQLQRWPEAIACYQSHLAYASTTGNDPVSAAIARLNLGEIYQQQGATGWAQAKTYYLAALAAFRQLHDEYQVMDVLTNLAALHQQMGEAAMALAYYDEALALAEDLRTRISSERGRVGYFAAVEALYANAILLLVEQGDWGRAFDLTEQARARAFGDRLALRSPDLARQWTEPSLTLAQVQAALPADSLLLAYFTTGLLDPQADDRNQRAARHRHRFPPAKTLLFAVTPTTLQVYDLGLSPNLLRPNHLENVVERHFLSRPLLTTLYQTLLTPVAAHLSRYRALYLAPHGPLHYIPFQALLAPDGEPLLRHGGPTLSYAPSATSLLATHAPATPSPVATMLAVGYNATHPAPLHYAEAEARLLAQMSDGIALVGAAPKSAQLAEQVGHYRFLHFSCHGAFDPHDPDASFLAIAANERLTAPLIRQEWQLTCEVATLSACESGLSRVRRGDELDGLVRAFFLAGAQALLATLWRVDERVTLLLMQHFYQQVLAGGAPATALQAAQHFVRHLTSDDAAARLATITPASTDAQPLAPDTDYPFADPRHWAAFVLFQRNIGFSR